MRPEQKYPVLTATGWQETPGILIDGWLINGVRETDGWGVTHLQSGRMLKDFRTYQRAVRFARSLQWHGVMPDMSEVEIGERSAATLKAFNKALEWNGRRDGRG